MLCRDWASYWIRIFHEPKNKCCHTIKDVRHWINIGCYIKEWKRTKIPANVQLQNAPITTSQGTVFQISTYEQKLSLIQAICLKYSYSRKYDIIMVKIILFLNHFFLWNKENIRFAYSMTNKLQRYQILPYSPDFYGQNYFFLF